MLKPITDSAALPAPGQAFERTVFDMKRTAAPDQTFELAKDVAAFANAAGGVILVGAVEDSPTGRLESYAPLPDTFAKRLHEAYSVAVKDRCRPQPLVDPVILARDEGYIVAINVSPFWLQPVGVRVKASSSDGFAGDTFVYPLRVGTTTAFLSPEQLPMHMAAQPRRAAILLAQVGNEPIKVMFSRKGKYDLPVKVAHISVESGTVEFCTVAQSVLFVVPLDAVRMVWFDPARKEWHAAVDGSFDSGAGSPTRQPLHYFYENS